MKKSLYSHREDPFFEEKITGMNRHLSNYEKATFVQKKIEAWKEVCKIADEISQMLPVR